MSVFIVSEQETIENDRGFGDYASWSTEYDFRLVSASIKAPVIDRFKQESQEFPIDVEVGDSVFALVVIYSSGDSFGTARGKGELVWAFSSKALAEEAKEEYKRVADRDGQNVNIKFETKDGIKPRKIGSVVWGHFETLQSIEIVELKVQ